jgi:general stress protein YciG
MADDNTSKQGFAGMDEEKQREIASKGGKASSEKQDMSELGKKGAEAQPTEAKQKGGENSHKNSNS